MSAYLKTKAVSELLDIPEGTLRYWRHIGEGPESFVLGKKLVVYSRHSVETWLARQQQATKRGGDVIVPKSIVRRDGSAVRDGAPDPENL